MSVCERDNKLIFISKLSQQDLVMALFCTKLSISDNAHKNLAQNNESHIIIVKNDSLINNQLLGVLIYLFRRFEQTTQDKH